MGERERERLLMNQTNIWPLGRSQPKEHCKLILLVRTLLQASKQGTHWGSFPKQWHPENKRLDVMGLVADIIACCGMFG